MTSKDGESYGELQSQFEWFLKESSKECFQYGVRTAERFLSNGYKVFISLREPRAVKRAERAKAAARSKVKKK